jgi:hypothetical protein
MSARIRAAVVVGALMAGASGTADAQYWRYPGGYRGYGWGGWGSPYGIDPGAGYMAGLGAYAQGQGAYEVADAKARQMNADTILKWNKALRERQRELRREQEEADARDQAENAARGREYLIESGRTLNDLLDRILEFNPNGSRAYAARAELSPNAIRDIPFEPATEAISICLDQMTGEDGWPEELLEDQFADRREAVTKAIDAALEEDKKGNVSRATMKRVNDAVASLRAQFIESAGDLDLGEAEADEFLKSLAGLGRMLHNPKVKEVLAQLEDYKGGTIGDLIGFMHAFNLRFGPATTDRQKAIYRQVAGQLQQVLADTGGQPDGRLPRDASGGPLAGAAREAFQGMSWKQLEAQSRP